jgi:hypothetical protein
VIQFRLSVDALGQTRFGYSPLAEAAASLRVLGQRSADFVVHPWLREVRDQLGRVDLELLLAVAPAGPLAPDFLFAWSSDPGTTIEQQLNELARTSPGRLRGDLEDCWKGRSMPATLRDLLPEGGGEAGPRRLADAIWQYWQAAIAPYWPRIRTVVDADVSFRGARVLTGGLFTLFADLHPEVTLQDRVLKIDKPHHPDVIYEGAQITLVPSVFVWPNLLVAHEGPHHQVNLTYAARGVARVWEGVLEPENSVGDHLAPARDSHDHNTTCARVAAKPGHDQPTSVGSPPQRSAGLMALGPQGPVSMHPTGGLPNRCLDKHRQQR